MYETDDDVAVIALQCAKILNTEDLARAKWKVQEMETELKITKQRLDLAAAEIARARRENARLRMELEK